MAKYGRIQGQFNQPWWKESESSAGRAMIDQFRWLDTQQHSHRDRNLKHLRMYSQRLAAGMSGVAFAQYDAYGDQSIKRNVCQSIVDAAVSQAAASEIRPMPLTIGGNYSLQKRAKKMAQYFDGQFYALDQHELSLQIMQDACIYGTGVEKVYPGFGRVNCERTNVDNIVVDDVEAQSGRPDDVTCKFEYREVNKHRLVERYKKFERQIMAAGLARDTHWGRHRLAEPVGVVEGWKLPSDENSEDGVHIIAIDNATLLYERWLNRRFPFSVMRWKFPPIGWYGMGICEEATPGQVEINFFLDKISRILWHTSNPLWAKRGTITASDLNNSEATIHQYDEVPPVSIPYNTNIGELFAHIDRVYQGVFSDTGISFLQATAQKPAGLSSGEALKTYNDTTSARFLHTMKRYERFHMDTAELMIDAERHLEKEGGSDRIVLSRGKKGLEELKFSEISIDKDKYQLQVFPTSFLPKTPAGKLDTLEKFGTISPVIQQQLVASLDFPDLEAAVSVANGTLNLTDMIIDRLLDDKVPPDEARVGPEPFWDHKYMLNRCQLLLVKSQVDHVPEERLQLLRDFMTDLQSTLNEKLASEAQQLAAQQAPALQAAPPQTPGLPPGLGGLPPGADLSQLAA